MKYFSLLVLLTVSLPSYAEEILFIPTGYIASKNFEYSTDNGGVSGLITSLGLQFTGVYDRFYITLSGEENPATAEESTKNLLFNKVNVDRTDLAISFGYEVNPSIRTFAGYKYGKTTLTELPYSPYPHAKTSLESKGVFIGAGGGWEVKDKGFISFSSAYAMLDATYANPTIESVEGKSSGTSLTVGWKAPITPKLAYEVLLTRHDYYYEDFAQYEYDISEQFLSLRIGLSYIF
jgi:hypothetical protein